MFIVFEGVDGSGKSTQLNYCHDWLKSLGIPVTVCQDPGTTTLGLRVRELLLERGDMQIDFTSEMFLFMAARAQLVSQIIKPALDENRIVLCDRFLLSTVVYQGHAGDLDPMTIWNIGRSATQGIEPTQTLVFDLPTETALARIGGQLDSMESRGGDFLSRVCAGFQVEAGQSESIHLIDATGTADDIHHQYVNPILAPLLSVRNNT